MSNKLSNEVNTLEKLIIVLAEETIHINDLVHLCKYNYWELIENPNIENRYAVVDNERYVEVDIDSETGNNIKYFKRFDDLVNVEVDVATHIKTRSTIH